MWNASGGDILNWLLHESVDTRSSKNNKVWELKSSVSQFALSTIIWSNKWEEIDENFILSWMRKSFSELTKYIGLESLEIQNNFEKIFSIIETLKDIQIPLLNPSTTFIREKFWEDSSYYEVWKAYKKWLIISQSKKYKCFQDLFDILEKMKWWLRVENEVTIVLNAVINLKWEVEFLWKLNNLVIPVALIE